MYTGTKEKMVELEKNFLDGLYTPFAPECALSEMDQNVAQPPPKKKRKWHNNSMYYTSGEVLQALLQVAVQLTSPNKIAFPGATAKESKRGKENAAEKKKNKEAEKDS